MPTPDHAVDPARLDRWADRLRSLPAIALPTDYPRPANSQVVTAMTSTRLDRRTRNAIARLALYTEEEEDQSAGALEEDDDDESQDFVAGPTAFHILLAAFVVLLHRYTGDTDLVIGTSSPKDGSPLILRVPIEPGDAFWQVVRRIQSAEVEAAADNLPFDAIAQRLDVDRQAAGDNLPAPLFRVRFLDETSGGAGRDFIQSTASTTDLTIFVTRPDAPVPGTEENASTPTTSTTTFGAASSTLRQSILPAIALHLSYNALLFSQARMSYLVNQLLHVVNTASANPTSVVGTINLRTQSEAKILPDPQTDLDWCGFRGSITSIFEQNAATFPDRRCLVESLTGETETGGLTAPALHVRQVTYGELDAASNVLAHHLLSNGVQREEVVTVYAHRGVDLVVAVLGTLKAGATFSVIDPAYPAGRQNIYLQVAKPRALVVLAKAGRLAPAVRQYIESDLDLRVEVPALELTPDGIVHGGATADGKDVLDAVQAKAKQSTGVILGPDSVGTLSFTSGSTGIPKGVRGRHHSLTHFFPWMGERFGLSNKDRFTMLSGIAHDPIQRDMFTPLFFGAELHIPTAEDIGTPGRLAEWMAATQATVTHLTPAMGQLLSAQASAAIPTLKNAFFVGDVLTKRDCTRLQSLAANVTIINMYGTTETQRAVSYFALPSINEDAAFLRGQKDIMPAGQGMVDVQLLVVNRNDRTVTTGVGEVGEIYVRSGGLAEGYLGPAEMSAEKFVPNFLATDLQWPDTLKGTPEGQFWHGVRDRMYRTGDLGRYLPDGTVECTGRADDQVKIRGFRIELGEIDTHLSRHAHVRENVTLVRRDKNEDKVLVSYFVPGDGSDDFEEELSSAVSSDEGAATPRDAALVKAVKKYRLLIKDIREFLKRKLPSYSVPTLFVPMSKMPLNPNGKIDKPALPFPDTVLANAAALKSKKNRSHSAERKLSSTEATVAQLWTQLLPSVSQPVPTDESFFDLGGHSILATRLVFELRKAFVINVPLGVVFDHPTLAGLATVIDSIRAQDSSLGLSVPGTTAAADTPPETDYASDLAPLSAELPELYPPTRPATDQLTVLLTGATGFLGSYVLADLLHKRKNVARVLAHVRAKDTQAGLQRLETSCVNRGVWDPSWMSQGRVEAVVGDLEKERLGVDAATWDRLSKEVDVIIHNGALVHWVYPYQRLRAANVLSTQALLKLAGKGKPKTLTFVSSTSALDTPYYTALSDSVTSSGNGSGVPENDDLNGSRQGLKTGYGQSKWVAEQLVMAAVARGARAGIVRPGYVVGDSQSGTCNTDDFLIRLIKGCAQLGAYAEIRNLVNMVPVDHVARITALASLDITLASKRVLQSPSGLGKPFTPTPVFHVEGHPKVTYDLVLGSLALYGWDVHREEYMTWRKNLEEHVLKNSKNNEEDNALFPLLHFVLDDLPTSTKSPSLDDRNTQRVLSVAQEAPANGVAAGMTTETLGLYLAWLAAVGFLPRPVHAAGEKIPAMSDQEDEQGNATVLALPTVLANANAALGRASAH